MQYMAQRDVPTRDMKGVIEHHIPAIIVSGVAAEIRTGRPTPNISQKFLTESSCAAVGVRICACVYMCICVYVHVCICACVNKTVGCLVDQVENGEMVVACTYRRRRETQTRLCLGNLKKKDFLEDQVVDGNALLNCVLKKQEERA